MATPRRPLGLQPAYTPSPLSRTASSFGTEALYSPRPSPRTAASPRTAFSGNTPRLTTALSSSLLSSSASRLTTAGFIQASDSTVSSIQVQFKQHAVETEELMRDVTKTQLDSMSLGRDLSLETGARQELQRQLLLERDERNKLGQEVLKLQAAFKAQATLAESAERRLKDFPARLEKVEDELRLCAREGQERDRMDEFKARFTVRLDSQAEALKSYHTDHKETTGTLQEVLKTKHDNLVELTRVQEMFAKQLYDFDGRHKKLHGELVNSVNHNNEAIETMAGQLNHRIDVLQSQYAAAMSVALRLICA